MKLFFQTRQAMRNLKTGVNVDLHSDEGQKTIRKEHLTACSRPESLLKRVSLKRWAKTLPNVKRANKPLVSAHSVGTLTQVIEKFGRTSTNQVAVFVK